MLYVKLDANGTVQKYPYNLSELSADFPNTSFTIPVEEVSLNNRGIFKVEDTTKPETEHTKEVVEVNPVFENGRWIQVWSIINSTQQEIETKYEITAATIRKQRDQLLLNTDWTQVEDAPVNKQAWAVYRQALRNITTQTNFPWSVTWPTQPV